jgi:orotidine-5'-phosphate decarboxylase
MASVNAGTGSGNGEAEGADVPADVSTDTSTDTSTEPRRTVVPIVALDYPDARSALELVSRLGDSCRFYKVGSELFTASGPGVVEALRHEGYDVFLDLKLHDIPNTVAGAMRRIGAMGVRLTTVHASGGRAMLEAAVTAAGGECGVLAVTVLTSLNGTELEEAFGPGNESVDGVVMRLADLARGAGARGIVCSGREARRVRERFGRSLELLVPGIRLPGDAADDQSRVVTPEAAAAAGADYVVLGRVVSAAGNPRQVMADIKSRLTA